ncbi:MAG: DUF4382 domain-containing protein [Betaproteobacteria bacterium]|nr:MAG: DUF4382 domain-containing protein [Betaproteobacteria bacterium]
MSWKECFGNRRFLRFVAVSLVAAAVAAGLYACKKTDEEGVVAIGLTDTPGDFLTYTVDVTSLTLTKADNTTVVQTLPQTTRIDFAQVVDLTEFITGATIPAGTYVSATLNVDYTNADIRVDDGTGTAVAVPLTNILDTQNRQVTTLPMKVTLDNARQLVIAPLVSSLLDLDFNLAASNLVDMSVPASPVVTVNPLLVADVNPDSPKPHRIRGPLDSVNTQAGSFTLILRPFNLLQGNHGRITFVTDSNTTFEIDQVNYVGSAGLTALAAKSQLTATVAIGTLNLTTRRFIATEVLAGSSVPFGISDVMTGNVISRSSSTTFVVKGAELVRSDGTLIFRDTVTVTVASGTTKVIKQGTPGTFATGDISVGQRVIVFGILNAAGTTMDATNATSGLVRLLVTQLNGPVNSAGSGVVAMTLARIDGRPIGLFNFSGTGTTVGNDASPISYQVAAGALSLAGITNGTPLKVRGFVQPFGQATATDDFNAITLVDVSNAPATLVVGWPSLEAAPFNSYAPSGMVVNLTNAGLLHDVFRGGVDTRLSTSATPSVQAANPARGLFVIGANGTVQVYTQLGNYQAALQANLAAGLKARSFVASGGTYVDATQTLTANAMAAALQ